MFYEGDFVDQNFERALQLYHGAHTHRSLPSSFGHWRSRHSERVSTDIVITCTTHRRQLAVSMGGGRISLPYNIAKEQTYASTKARTNDSKERTNKRKTNERMNERKDERMGRMSEQTNKPTNERTSLTMNQ